MLGSANMSPIKLLRKMCANRQQADVAAELGVSAQYLNDILQGRRLPGEKVLRPLGLERVVKYRRRDSAQASA